MMRGDGDVVSGPQEQAAVSGSECDASRHSGTSASSNGRAWILHVVNGVGVVLTDASVARGTCVRRIRNNHHGDDV